MALFQTSGVCSRSIAFDIDAHGRLHNVRFERGCHGNGQGIARLAEGRPASEVAAILDGVRCEGKATSCPDQLSRAIRHHLGSQEAKPGNQPELCDHHEPLELGESNELESEC